MRVWSSYHGDYKRNTTWHVAIVYKLSHNEAATFSRKSCATAFGLCPPHLVLNATVAQRWEFSRNWPNICWDVHHQKFLFTCLFELKINQMCSCCVFVKSFDSSSCNQETYVILTYSLSVTVRSVTQSVARKMSIVVFQCMEDIWKERGWEQDICQQTKTTTTALTTLKTTTTTTFKTMAATKRLVVPQLRCLSQQQISSAAENYPKIWKNGLT